MKRLPKGFELMENMYNKYVKFILRLNPPTWWKFLRGILHWLTLPIKLLVIGGITLFQKATYLRKMEVRTLPALPDEETRISYVKTILKVLPVIKKDGQDLYVNRVPYTEKPDGLNHNTDHQASRQGTYLFLMAKVGKITSGMYFSLAKHIRKGNLMRGYLLDSSVSSNGTLNQRTVSGDMLIGMSLGVMSGERPKVDPKVLKIAEEQGIPIVWPGSPFESLADAFDEMVKNLIHNDFAILEKARPQDGPERLLWDELKSNLPLEIDPDMKSARGHFQPGFETVGAQALTVLAALRVAEKKCANPYAKKAYRKLLWQYGYGLLSLFPTTFKREQRGYFNDHNCIVSAYILAKLADSKWGKIFWGLSMLYTWSLSKKWYNGYFTGLLYEIFPTDRIKAHLEECRKYLYEERPLTFAREGGLQVAPELLTNVQYPVAFNQMDQQEFHPDQEHRVLIKTIGDTFYTTENTLSGLGWLAHAVMTDNEIVKKADEELANENAN